MRTRLLGGIVALVISLGALAFPSATPAQAGSVCTGWRNTLLPPTSIRVYRTATKRTETVPFRAYVEKVMAAEWNASSPVAALRAGAVAVKQYGWYYAMHWRGGRDAAGRCYDVTDSSKDQIYDPKRSVRSTIRAAVDATWQVTVRRSDRMILTGYRPGTGRCTANVDGYRLYQRDAVDCVRRHRDTMESLVRRFYKSAGIVTTGLNDFSGDGRGDAVAIVRDADTSDTTARLFTTGATPTASTTSSLGTLAADALLGRAATDVDADGRPDIVQLVAVDATTVELQVMRAVTGGFAPAARWWTSADDPAAILPATLRFVAGDFNGDGRGDAGIVRLSPPEAAATGALWVTASLGNGFAPARRYWLSAGDYAGTRFLAGDFSGDGRADLALVSGDQTTTQSRVAVTSAATLLMSAPTTWSEEPAPPEQITLAVGDANRDGRDDLFLVRQVSAGVRVLVNRSSGSAFVRTWFGVAIALPFAGTRVTTSDLNRDGRADLLAYEDLGVDAEEAPLGTAVWRFYSDGKAYTGARWLTDPTLIPATFTPH